MVYNCGGLFTGEVDLSGFKVSVPCVFLFFYLFNLFLFLFYLFIFSSVCLPVFSANVFECWVLEGDSNVIYD